MFCANCGKQTSEDEKFCGNCGNKATALEKQRSGDARLDDDVCQLCGSYAKTKYVEFYQNIGALLLRFHKSIKGRLCKKCITKTFWNYTLTNLFLGWWGVISFLITPFYIVNNIFRYLTSLRLF